jgi:hypothetical protein
MLSLEHALQFKRKRWKNIKIVKKMAMLANVFPKVLLFFQEIKMIFQSLLLVV